MEWTVKRVRGTLWEGPTSPGGVNWSQNCGTTSPHEGQLVERLEGQLAHTRSTSPEEGQLVHIEDPAPGDGLPARDIIFGQGVSSLGAHHPPARPLSLSLYRRPRRSPASGHGHGHPRRPGEPAGPPGGRGVN